MATDNITQLRPPGVGDSTPPATKMPKLDTNDSWRKLLPENLPASAEEVVAEVDSLVAQLCANAARKRLRQREQQRKAFEERQEHMRQQGIVEKAQEHQCKECKDQGVAVVWSKTGKQGWGDNRYDIVPCACKAKAIAEKRAQRVKSASNLTPEMEHMTFASYDQSWDKEAYGHARDFALALAGGGKPEKPFLFLSGTYGSGKTHLLAAIAHAAIAQDRQPMFVVVPRLMDWLRAGYDKDNTDERLAFQARLDGICNVDVLLLDDLGAEQETKWTNDKLYQILNDRYARRLPTVISSNLDADDLEDRIADRVWDLAVCQQIYTVKQSYRRRAARARQKGGA